MKNKIKTHTQHFSLIKEIITIHIKYRKIIKIIKLFEKNNKIMLFYLF